MIRSAIWEPVQGPRFFTLHSVASSTRGRADQWLVELEVDTSREVTHKVRQRLAFWGVVMRVKGGTAGGRNRVSLAAHRQRGTYRPDRHHGWWDLTPAGVARLKDLQQAYAFCRDACVELQANAAAIREGSGVGLPQAYRRSDI